MSTDDPHRDEPYHARLRRLREARGLSRGEFYKLTQGLSIDTVIALERDPSNRAARYPSADTLEKLAHALGVEPAEFPEYRLSRARELLDERTPGSSLRQALGTLEHIEEALQVARAQRLAEAADPIDGNPRPRAASAGPVPKRRATDRRGQ